MDTNLLQDLEIDPNILEALLLEEKEADNHPSDEVDKTHQPLYTNKNEDPRKSPHSDNDNDMSNESESD